MKKAIKIKVKKERVLEKKSQYWFNPITSINRSTAITAPTKMIKVDETDPVGGKQEIV